jgi:hypothetical protein
MVWGICVVKGAPKRTSRIARTGVPRRKVRVNERKAAYLSSQSDFNSTQLEVQNG